MTTLPQVASVHPKTITDLSTGAIAPQGPKRWRISQAGEPSTTVVRVHPQVWQEALRLCDGTPSRIRVLSATEVVVTNG